MFLSFAFGLADSKSCHRERNNSRFVQDRFGSFDYLVGMNQPSLFTPALGRAELTSDYDRVIAVMTREAKWRTKLVDAIAPQTNETIVDLGSGTGSLAVMLAQAAPEAHVFAVDPDPEFRQ